MSELITVGQVVSLNALHWVPPCSAYPILLQIVGLLIKYLNKDIHTHGLVTLTYLIMMEIISGYPDVALRILTVHTATTITIVIVFIYLPIVEPGMVTVIMVLIGLLVVVSIPFHPRHYQHYSPHHQLLTPLLSQLPDHHRLHPQSHPQLVVKLIGVIIIITVISSISELISVGQVVSLNALHWVPPCYAYPILPQINGLLIKYINYMDLFCTHGLVTLTYLIMMETMSGYPDVVLRILIVHICIVIVLI